MAILPEKLIGKVSRHCAGDDGEASWFRGAVLAIKVGKTQRNPEFVIRYNGYDEPFLFFFYRF